MPAHSVVAVNADGNMSNCAEVSEMLIKTWKTQVVTNGQTQGAECGLCDYRTITRRSLSDPRGRAVHNVDIKEVDLSVHGRLSRPCSDKR